MATNHNIYIGYVTRNRYTIFKKFWGALLNSFNKDSMGKTGTTIVGWKGKDFVLLVSDRQSTYGSTIGNTKAKKVFLVGNNFGISFAGGLGDAQKIMRVLDGQVRLYEVEREKKMKTSAISNYVSNVLNYTRYYPYMAFFLIAGFDSKPELYSVDLVGGSESMEKYTAFGSGSMFAIGYLEQNYSDKFNKKQALEQVVKAISSSKKKDVYTGGEGLDYIVIDKNGIEEGSIE